MTDAAAARGTILLAYDGSADAGHAIERAGALFSGAEAIVVTVWQPFALALASSGFAGVPPVPDNVDELDRQIAEAAGRTAGDGAERAKGSGLSARPLAIEGDGPTWRSILRTADEHAVAAIVMAPRGRGGISSMLLRSVSRGVVRHAHRPVVVIPREAP